MIESAGLRWIDLATFLVAFLTLYRLTARPRVRLYFWDQITNKYSKEVTLPTGNATLQFLFHNQGDLLRLFKPAATILTAFIYFPESFEIIEARRYEAPMVKSNEVFRASPSGKFAKMRYIAVPSVYEVRPPAISILSYDEDVICEVDIRIPDEVGKRQEAIFCQIASREGDLRVHKLTVRIEARS